MLRRISQRTAVAITLVGVLLLSVGTCVVPAQPAAKSCCMHMSMPCEGKADCCKVSPQIPLAAVTPLFSGSASMTVTEDFLSAAMGPASRQAAIVPVAPSQSSPPGIFILRI
jgi:hypothetical protein